MEPSGIDEFAAAPVELVAAPAEPPLSRERPVEQARPGLVKAAWELLHDLSIAVLFCFFFISFVAQAFRVQGTSMLPLLEDSERIVVNKLAYRLGPIERGDVVVFWWPRDPAVSFIKRVVGLPGDVVEMRGGAVFVNDKPLAEPYLSGRFRDDESFEPRPVSKGYYFVLGDHRNSSNDSRNWGEVPEKYIYGRAALRFWPLAKWGFIE